MYEGSGFIPNFQEETSNVENIQLQQLDLQSDPQPPRHHSDTNAC